MSARAAPAGAPYTVVHYTDTAGYGGAEAMLLTLIQGLDRDLWRCVLVHHAEPGAIILAEEARRLGIEVETLPIARPGKGLAAVAELRRRLGRYRARVFHAHLTWGLRCTRGIVAAALAGIPHRVVTQQLFVPPGSARRQRRQRAVSLLVDRYIAVSHAMSRRLAPALLGRRKVAVVHNGVDVARFSERSEAALRAQLTADAGRPLVLCVARLTAQKGVDTLIAAAEQVPEAMFAIAGEGPDRARLEREVTSRGLHERVRFLGHRADVESLLAACDAFVLPSLFEGLPVSVLEAMAAGRPVVASAIEGTEEAVIDGVTGLLVTPGEPLALAAALRRVLHDRALADRLGTAARVHVEREFSARSLVEGVDAIYRELIGMSRVPTSDAPARIAGFGGQRMVARSRSKDRSLA